MASAQTATSACASLSEWAATGAVQFGVGNKTVPGRAAVAARGVVADQPDIPQPQGAPVEDGAAQTGPAAASRLGHRPAATLLGVQAGGIEALQGQPLDESLNPGHHMDRPEAPSEKPGVPHLAQCDTEVTTQDADILLEQECRRAVERLGGDWRFHTYEFILGRIPFVVGLDRVLIGQSHINGGASQSGIEFDGADKTGIGLTDQLFQGSLAIHLRGAHHTHRIHPNGVEGEDFCIGAREADGPAGRNAGHLPQPVAQEAGSLKVQAQGVGALYIHRHLVMAHVVGVHPQHIPIGGGEQDTQARDGLAQGLVVDVIPEIPGHEDRTAQDVLGGTDAEVQRDRSPGQVGHLARRGAIHRREGARHGEDHRDSLGVTGHMDCVVPLVVGDRTRLVRLPLAVIVEVGEDGDTRVATLGIAQGALDVAPHLERTCGRAAHLGGHHAVADATKQPKHALRQVGSFPGDVDRPGAVGVDGDRYRVGEASVARLRNQVKVVAAGVSGVGQGHQDLPQARVVRVAGEAGDLEADVDVARVDQGVDHRGFGIPGASEDRAGVTFAAFGIRQLHLAAEHATEPGAQGQVLSIGRAGHKSQAGSAGDRVELGITHLKPDAVHRIQIEPQRLQPVRLVVKSHWPEVQSVNRPGHLQVRRSGFAVLARSHTGSDSPVCEGLFPGGFHVRIRLPVLRIDATQFHRAAEFGT